MNLIVQCIVFIFVIKCGRYIHDIFIIWTGSDKDLEEFMVPSCRSSLPMNRLAYGGAY